MPLLLLCSRKIDLLNHWVARLLWCSIFASVAISAGNAIYRKIFSDSSNALLEIQWYLFAISFLCASGYTLLHNQHVRIDVITARFSERTRIKLDIVGYAIFFFPVVLTVIYYAWPYFAHAFITKEGSSNAGGLIRWWVLWSMPVGFFLLFLQGISEVIKRFAFLQGLVPNPMIKNEPSAEEELAQEISKRSNVTT